MNDDTLTVRFAALADPHDDSDWLDVVRRAGTEQRTSRAWLALPVAAALVALVVGSAFAYYRDVVDFFQGEKAPPAAREFFEYLSVDVPPPFEDPQAMAEEARRFAVPTVDGGTAGVVLAPTSSGGFCQSWDAPFLWGGCQDVTAGPLGVTSGASPGRGAWITVGVDPRYVARVEVRFDDGTIVELPLTWISSPIDHGFGFYEFAPHEHDREAVVALDDEGKVVTQYEFDPPLATGQPLDAVFPERMAVVEVSSGRASGVMWRATTRYGAECAWLAVDNRHDAHCAVPLAVRSTPQTVLVFGRVGDDDEIVDLRYADGDTDSVRAEDGVFLFEIPEEHLEPETALTSMTVRGAIVDKEPWLAMTVSEWPGCRPLPLPEGKSCPWGP